MHTSLDDPAVASWQTISYIIGWGYIILWGVSFYPQPLYNWKRKSTSGLSCDYTLCNLVGAVAHTINTGVLVLSSVIREQYAQRHPTAPEPSTRFNDFVYALHAVAILSISSTQFISSLWGFEKNKTTHSRPSPLVLFLLAGCFLTAVAVTLLIAVMTPAQGMDASGWAWLDLVDLFGYIKLFITLIKYTPQAYLNYMLKSTAGFAITGVLMDLGGGVLSLMQLGIDCSLQGDWTQVTSNPVKFGLANISNIFCIIYMWQHYVLYRKERGLSAAEVAVAVQEHETVDEESPLLGDGSQPRAR